MAGVGSAPWRVLGGGGAPVQSMVGVLRAEMGGRELWAAGKPGRNGSTSQTMACTPGVLGLGRMRWENWSLVLSRSSPNVRPRSSGEGCTESGAASASSPDAPCARGEGGARGWHGGLEKRGAGLGPQSEGSTAAWLVASHLRQSLEHTWFSRRRWASDGDPARLGMTRAAWSWRLRPRAGSRAWPWSGVQAQDA